MKYSAGVLVWLGVSVALAGCSRISTQIVEKPRVDQELGEQSGGNRGFLVGKAPAAPARKATRSIFETNVELPTRSEMNPWKRKTAATTAPVPPQPVAPSPVFDPELIAPAGEDLDIEPVGPGDVPDRSDMGENAPEGSTVYVVKSGDTLDKISMKVYGTSTKWRKIYEANQDAIKSPNRIYPGQKLMIPALSGGNTQASSSDNSDIK